MDCIKNHGFLLNRSTPKSSFFFVRFSIIKQPFLDPSIHGNPHIILMWNPYESMGSRNSFRPATRITRFSVRPQRRSCDDALVGHPRKNTKKNRGFDHPKWNSSMKNGMKSSQIGGSYIIIQNCVEASNIWESTATTQRKEGTFEHCQGVYLKKWGVPKKALI